MKRHLQIKIRRGGRFKRTKKFLKVLGLSAAALALAKSPVAQNFFSKLKNKVDEEVKRKVKEYGKSLGEGIRQGADPDDLLLKLDTIAQGNLLRLEAVMNETLAKSDITARELLKKVDEIHISRAAAWLAGGHRSESETRAYLNNQSWWNPFSYGQSE
jgi:hypothetical protein